MVTSPAQAAALVIASDPRFADVAPVRPDVIGQSAGYEAHASGDGYQVAITVGWGDCPAGCIDHHTWTFQVGRDGTIGTPSESGDVVPHDLPTPPPLSGQTQLEVVLVAGPVCPVETEPPQPGCEPRPVAGATVVVRDPQGAEVARITSDERGMASATLPAGVYVIEALPGEGLMRAPEPVAAAVPAPGPFRLVLSYDTGIR